MSKYAPYGTPALASAIIVSLRTQPEMWRRTSPSGSRLRHQSGIEIWVYVGEFMVKDPREIQFGWLDWFRLRGAYKYWARLNKQRVIDSGLDLIAALEGAR